LNISGADFNNVGQFDANGGTLVLGKGIPDFNHGGSTYHDVIKSGAGSTTGTSSGVSRRLPLNGRLTVESGTFATDNADVISVIPAVNGGIVINNGTTFNLADTSTLNIEGGFTNKGSFIGASSATLHLIGSEFTPGASTYLCLLETSEKVTQVEDSTFKFAGDAWTNYGQYQAKSGSTVELNGTNQTITTIGSDKAYIAFEDVKTNNSGTKTFETDVRISGEFVIAGGATVKDVVSAAVPFNVYTFTNEDAKMVVSGE